MTAHAGLDALARHYDDDVRAAIRRTYKAPTWRVFEEVTIRPKDVGVKDLKGRRRADFMAIRAGDNYAAIGIEHKRSLGDLRRGMADDQWLLPLRCFSQYGVLWTGHNSEINAACNLLPKSGAGVDLWLWHLDDNGRMKVYRQGVVVEPHPAFLCALLVNPSTRGEAGE